MKLIVRLRKSGIVDILFILFLLLAGYAFSSGFWQNLYWMFTSRPPVLVDVD